MGQSLPGATAHPFLFSHNRRYEVALVGLRWQEVLQGGRVGGMQGEAQGAGALKQGWGGMSMGRAVVAGRARCDDDGGGAGIGQGHAGRRGPCGGLALPSEYLWKPRKMKIHTLDISPSFIHLPKTLGKPEMFALPSSRQGSFQGNDTESKATE